MSYGSVYIASDIGKLKSAGYSKRYIIRIISRRIKYRYSYLSIKDAKRIATDSYNGNSESKNWMPKRKSTSTIAITERELRLWKKLELDSI